MATNYPTFQSDPRLNSVSASLATITTVTASVVSASSYTGIPVGAGGVISVTAGTNITSSGASTIPTISLTSSITGGLTNISGTTTITSVSGNYTVLTGALGLFNALSASTGVSSSLGLFNSITGSHSGTLALFTTVTASNISSSGNISLGGSITLSNAGGIVFGSSYAGPTGSSTTLDDYEVGTWTPALSSSAVFTSTAPLATTRGTYVKIGKKVFVQCTINLTSTGSATGPVWLVGLPFGCHAYQSGIISPTSWYSMNASLNTLFVGYLLSLTTTAQLVKATAGGITGVPTTDFTNTAQLHFNGSYEVS